jgi:multiple sugar transport system permease protein
MASQGKLLTEKQKQRRKEWIPVLLTLPTLVFLCVFCFYPMIRGFGYSVTDYNRSDPGVFNMIGMQNFIEIFTEDKVFFTTVINSVKWVAFEVVAQLVCGMCFALVLHQEFRGRGFIRTFCFAPWAVSGVLTTMLWMLIYNEHIGMINQVLDIVGLGEYTTAWVQSLKTAFRSVAIAELWRGIPFFTITLLGGLQTIPLDLYESARVDGGTPWTNFWKITLPYMKESIVFATLMRTIWEFRSVDLIMTMTNGGPVRKTLTLPIYMYQTSIIDGKYGYGAALTVILFLILSIYVYVYLKANSFGKGVNDD